MADDEDWARVRTELSRRIDVPDYDVVSRRAERRNRLRRSRIAGVAVLVVVMVGIPVLGSRIGHRNGDGLVPMAPSSPTAGTPAPPTTTSAAPTSPTSPTSSATPDPQAGSGWEMPVRSLLGADFADARSGFALVQHCPGARLPCTFALAVTPDNGGTWIERSTPVPVLSSNETGEPTLTALTASHVLVRVPADQPAADRAWFSPDAGRHWQPVNTQPSGTISALPDGAVFEAGCAGYGECVSAATVRLPTTGMLVTLTKKPAILVEDLFQAGDNGDWWMVGRTSTTSARPVLAHSGDQGRSWTTTTLPDVGAPYFRVAISESGHFRYAAVIGELPGVKNGLLAIYRTVDGGFGPSAGWTVLWRARTGTEPRSVEGVLVAGPDSGLTAFTDDGQCYQGTGTTFTRLTCPYQGWVTWNRHGYLTWTGRSAEQLSRSTDGLHWTTSTP